MAESDPAQPVGNGGERYPGATAPRLGGRTRLLALPSSEKAEFSEKSPERKLQAFFPPLSPRRRGKDCKQELKNSWDRTQKFKFSPGKHKSPGSLVSGSSSGLFQAEAVLSSPGGISHSSRGHGNIGWSTCGTKVAPGVGTGPGRALKIRTFGVAGGTSQEALEEAEEGCDTISGTHNIDETDCHDSRACQFNV